MYLRVSTKDAPYRVPDKLKPEVDRQIKELLAADMIRPSNNPYSHPLVCILKMTSDLKLCVNYNYVNAGTANSPLP